MDSFNNVNIYPQNVIGFNSQDVLIIAQQDIPGVLLWKFSKNPSWILPV